MTVRRSAGRATGRMERAQRGMTGFHGEKLQIPTRHERQAWVRPAQ